MSIGLIILLALAAWALGPLILRCAGGLLTSFALVLWAIPMQTRTSTAALAFAGITGAAMWHSGASWRARRDAARITGERALTLHRLIAHDIVPLRRARNARDDRLLAGDQAWSGDGNHNSYRAAHIDPRDEDIIDGVAYDLEPDPRG
jgi:hypothetical protein